jgi:hypothetical protein
VAAAFLTKSIVLDQMTIKFGAHRLHMYCMYRGPDFACHALWQKYGTQRGKSGSPV